MRKRFFRIAEHNISVSFVDETANDTFLSPSFEPFEIKEADDGCIFSLNVHDSIKPYSKEQRERIGIFVKDHIIIGGRTGESYSFREHELIEPFSDTKIAAEEKNVKEETAEYIIPKKKKSKQRGR